VPVHTPPVLHLSIPVGDLKEARNFYVDVLGCHAARSREGFCDVWFHGMQVTLHHRPGEVAPAGSEGPAAGSCRHFGVTLERDEFDAAVARVEMSAVAWIVPPGTDDVGLPTEQTKAKLADPSGNVIELKTYPDVESALEISSDGETADVSSSRAGLPAPDSTPSVGTGGPRTDVAASGHASLDYLATNVADWTRQAADQRKAGRRAWSRRAPTWGIFAVPESEVGMLPKEAKGLRILELGCGTGYVSAWLARRGGIPVAFDPTPSQLEIAGELQREFETTFPLVRSAAEHLPFADDSFDFAISEYGAAIWADPYKWIPEVARVLRPGAELTFLGNSSLLMLFAEDEDEIPTGERLRRPQFGMYRFDWPAPEGTEFHLSHGDWIRLLRANGFEILELLELRPSVGATTRYTFVTYDWARQWPCEEAWRVRLSGDPR
jgi:extradiol dioxygenase family protein/SAM-dependent methyltransferase